RMTPPQYRGALRWVAGAGLPSIVRPDGATGASEPGSLGGSGWVLIALGAGLGWPGVPAGLFLSVERGASGETGGAGGMAADQASSLRSSVNWLGMAIWGR
ncbi:MAG: hypothetical protein HC929_23775, partial [Leptolyngbyaceae cyanobacterium SM2_5_2]|nr:hypothetical protein [Leptolyngbyaceae cyanobacterium SM2_5_2]